MINYISHLKGYWFIWLGMFFLNVHAEVGKKKIEYFMLRWKQKKNPSASYQNQMINAIKFYYDQVEERNREKYSVTRPKKATQLTTVLTKEEIFKLMTYQN